jgi:2-polyprenyl-3-methyl-5-hydroxy-6-metoxy-1,4-benzoquinol methylase
VGTLSFYLASLGFHVTSVDISSDAIKICKKYQKFSKVKNIEFICGDVEKLKIKNKYDLIVCTEVIEHLEDDYKILRNLHSKLKNTGYLFLSTPSSNAPLFKLGCLKEFDRDVGHLRRYDGAQLVKLIEHTGYKLIKLIKTEGLLRNSLFTIKGWGIVIKLIKGPLVPLFHIIDETMVKVCGESDLIVIAQKK